MSEESWIDRMVRLEEEAEQVARAQQWRNVWSIAKLIALIGIVAAIIKLVWKAV